MKNNLKLLGLLALASLSFSGCLVQRSVSVDKAANNPDYTVSYLFEHDGCRVYRFYDTRSASYVYFTTQGDVTERQYIHKKSWPIATVCFILPKFATSFSKPQQTQQVK